MSRYVIGLDVGAGSMKILSLLSGQSGGEIRRKTTPAFEGREVVLSAILSMIEEEIEWRNGDGLPGLICIGTPGLVDEEGVITGAAVNIEGWIGVPLKQYVQDRFQVPVAVLNDVTLTAYGEYKFGAGASSENMVCVSIGTGIGGGIVLDGKLYRGTVGLAGEFGHILVEPKGTPCNCGRRGCVETYSSARGIVNQCLREQAGFNSGLAQAAREKPESVTAELVYRFLEQGDPFARRIHETSCEMLARAVGTIMNMLAPDTIVLCGGVMASGAYILPEISERISQYSLPAIEKTTALRAGSLGKDAGVLGAVGYGIDHCQ